jgi:hypothetical protein
LWVRLRAYPGGEHLLTVGSRSYPKILDWSVKAFQGEKVLTYFWY